MMVPMVNPYFNNNAVIAQPNPKKANTNIIIIKIALDFLAR